VASDVHGGPQVPSKALAVERFLTRTVKKLSSPYSQSNATALSSANLDRRVGVPPWPDLADLHAVSQCASWPPVRPPCITLEVQVRKIDFFLLVIILFLCCTTLETDAHPCCRCPSAVILSNLQLNWFCLSSCDYSSLHYCCFLSQTTKICIMSMH